MLIPKQVFPIHKACDTESSRYALGGVRLERNKDGSPVAVVTDGRRLVHCTWHEEAAGEFPAVDADQSHVADFGTIVPAKQWQEARLVYPNPDFPDQSDGTREGYYIFPGDKESSHKFRAGSYSGYNEWRAILSGFVHGVDPEVIWHDYESYRGKPFVELIHFSDCEGVIGPTASAKLAKDFADWQAAADEQDQAFSRVYNNFRKAFELAASGNGCVRFH